MKNSAKGKVARFQ